VPRPLRLDFAGGVYHVMARGNEKRDIFRDDGDRVAYLDRVAACSRRFEFRIYAYCLMRNHVHLAIERGPVALSRIVLALHSAYAGGFNRRHGRVGHLFQGRYKAFLVERDGYLLTLVRYIHLNPVKAGLVSRPEAYPWSSERFYRGSHAPAWLDRDAVLAMLGTARGMSGIAYRQLMAADQPSYDAIRPVCAAIKGSAAYVEKVLSWRPPEPDRRRWTIQRIAECVAASSGVTIDELLRPGQRSFPARLRGMAALIGRSYAGIPLARTARFFGRDESTAVRAVSRLQAELAENGALKAQVAKVAVLLESSRVHG